jgi:hypothetical protein
MQSGHLDCRTTHSILRYSAHTRHGPWKPSQHSDMCIEDQHAKTHHSIPSTKDDMINWYRTTGLRLDSSCLNALNFVLDESDIRSMKRRKIATVNNDAPASWRCNYSSVLILEDQHLLTKIGDHLVSQCRRGSTLNVLGQSLNGARIRHPLPMCSGKHVLVSPL